MRCVGEVWGVLGVGGGLQWWLWWAWGECWSVVVGGRVQGGEWRMWHGRILGRGIGHLGGVTSVFVLRHWLVGERVGVGVESWCVSTVGRGVATAVGW